MKAVLFDGNLKFAEDHPLPVPDEGEALIRVLKAGICRTDIEIIKGYMAFRGVIGHEFVGVVEKGNSSFKGKRVVGGINLSCGACEYCLKGLRTHCRYRSVLGIYKKNGSMAEYLTLPYENLHFVPDNVSDEEAVFTEPFAAAFEILQQVHLRPTDRVLVMGDGKLGLLSALILRGITDVTLAGRHEGKMQIAKNQGVNAVNIDDLKIERVFDVVVEATGSAGGLEASMGFVKPRGRIVLKSTLAEGKSLNLSPLVVEEITVIGSRCGPFGPAIKALSDKTLDVRPLITGIYPFSKAQEAFEKARERESLKVIIDF